MDEALNANVMVIAHEALERGVPPTYTQPLVVVLINWAILMPAWIVLGWLAWIETNQNPLIGIGTSLSLITLHLFTRRFRRQQRREIKHCLLYTYPSPRDKRPAREPSYALKKI